MEFIVTKEEVDARSGAAKEMNSKRGLSTGYIYTPVYTYRSQALLLHEVATSNSTICAERTRSFIFHRRGGCTPIDAATNYPEICTHGAHHSLSLPPFFIAFIGHCFFLPSGHNCLAFACTHPNCFFLLLESRSAVSIPRHCAYLSNVSFIRETSRHESLKRVPMYSNERTNRMLTFFRLTRLFLLFAYCI